MKLWSTASQVVSLLSPNGPCIYFERAVLWRPSKSGLTYRFGYDRGDGVRPLAAVENANGFALAFAYDAQGHLSQITDSAGRALAVACDAQGRVLAVVAPHPTEPRQTVTLVAYDYNGRGELVRVTDALGQAASYRYAQGLLVEEMFKNGLRFYFEYAGAGAEARCVHTWGDEGIYDHRLVYDVEAKRTVVTNSLGHATTYQGNENGLVVETWDARGGVTLTEYTDYNELLSETDALGHTTSHEYDERGNCVRVKIDGETSVERAFDAADQLISLNDAMGNKWQWQHDAQGNMLERAAPTGLVTRYTYKHGLLHTLTEASGRITTLHYDTAHNLQEVRSGNTQVSRAICDGWGRIHKATDVRGNVQWREHDLLGRVVQVHEPDGNVRIFSYDGWNNVTRTKDRYHDVQYAYRGLSRMIRRVEFGTAVEFLYDTEEQLRAVVNEHGLLYRFTLDAEGDVVAEAGFDGLTRHYVRDSGGRVTELLRPGGRRTHYDYAPTGQVSQVRHSDGSTETFRFAPNGAMLEAHNATATVAFTRSPLGRVLAETQNEHTVESEYDLFGNRISLRSSLGADVRYQYDKVGAVEQVQSGSWQALFERDAQGLEMQRTFSGGVRTEWRRDALGRPTEQRISTRSRREVRQRHYGWQADDRLTQIQDGVNGLTQFTYDALGNLAATQYGDGTQQLRLPDAVGNLFRASERKDRRYGPAGQLLEANGTCYEYDVEGNLVRKVTPTGEEWQYGWGASGRLESVLRPDGQAVCFTYDALGRRLSKRYRGQTTRWVWDGNVPLHEWTTIEDDRGTTDEVTTWLFEDDSFAPMAKLKGSANYSVVTDHLGTPLEMHSQAGITVWSAELDSYGRVRRGAGDVDACPFRYQGQYEDVETGLYYNRFRYYDPESGQYISQCKLPLKVSQSKVEVRQLVETRWGLRS